MALNGKFVKLSTIIEKVFRDNKYDLEVQWADIAEWAAEAMDFIGVPQALIDKWAKIPITYFRGNLPCDLHTIVPGTVIDFNSKLPLRATTNVAYQYDRVDKLAADYTASNTYTNNDNIDPTVGTFQIDRNGYPIVPDDIDYLRAKQANKYIYYLPVAHPLEEQSTYSINNNYIFTSFEQGTIMMFYKAFPVDEEGLPLIPDNTRYKQGVAAYIKERIDYGLYRTGKLNKDIYERSERDWLWYCGSATSAAQMLTWDETESFKNQMVKLLPNINEHFSTFKYAGDQESLNLRTSLR